ncbi:MAG: DegV family protein [Lachnospiraceae bacterium]|nr:DegV family protein [Lachnospiraceae bacterium]
MSDYILSCCSTVDLSEEHLKSRNIQYTSMFYELGGVQYRDDLGKTIPYSEFYRRMTEGEMTKTSQLNAEDYISYFEPFLKEGKDILHLTLSSGISGTVNSANIAAEDMREKYPDRKVIIVDSLAASAGYGLLMDKLADLRDSGMGIEELASWAEEHRLNVNHWFFSSDLTFFIRGGRISKTSGFVGQVLNICPLMNVDYQGKLIVREKVRTKKRVFKVTAQKAMDLCEGGADYADKIFISNAACREDAQAVADLLESQFPKMKGKVEIFDIGTTIGAHTGPGTVAVFFWGKKRVD